MARIGGTGSMDNRCGARSIISLWPLVEHVGPIHVHSSKFFTDPSGHSGRISRQFFGNSFPSFSGFQSAVVQEMPPVAFSHPRAIFQDRRIRWDLWNQLGITCSFLGTD